MSNDIVRPDGSVLKPVNIADHFERHWVPDHISELLQCELPKLLCN